MLFLSLFVFLPEETEAATPAATISYNPPMKRRANIVPGEDGLAQFDGTIWVGIIGAGDNTQYIQLNMQAETDAGWPTILK